MTAILANIPFWLTVGLILIGAVLLTHGNRAGQSNLRSAGLAVISLALLLGVARFLIDTPAEKCEKRTRQLVDSANRQDWTQLQNLVDPDTAVDLSGREKGAVGKDIGKMADALAKKVGLSEVTVWELRTQQTPQQITVTLIAAYEVKDTGNQGHPSGWEFDYLPPTYPASSSGRWDLRTIKLLSLEGQSLQG
jgi:hypothetical protein